MREAELSKLTNFFSSFGEKRRWILLSEFPGNYVHYWHAIKVSKALSLRKPMYALTGLAAGITGTFMMTLFTTSYSLIFKKPFFVVQILRDMFGGKVKDRYIIATAIHYGIGVLFSLIFLLLILRNAFEFEIKNAMIFGAIVGTVGIIGWIIFFSARSCHFP